MALLASALLVPLLVSGAFVWAGWQSSDRLHHNEGVVVNLDQTVTRGGTSYTFGNQLGAQLVSLSGSQFDWEFGVSPSQAQAGLASGRYSVAVVIPSNFTQALLSKGAERGVLTIQTSPLASVDQKTLASTLAEAAQRGLARQLGSQALGSVYVTFNQVDKDLVVASSKAQDAATSAVSLSTLAGSASKQATQVKNDTASVATGSQSVADAATQANQSAQTATKSGTAGASAAAKAGSSANGQKNQASAAASGANGLSGSVTSAGTAASSASGQAGAIAGTSSGLTTTSTSIANSAKSASQSAQAYRQLVNSAVAQQQGLSSALAGVGAAVTTYQGGVTTFAGAIRGWSTTVSGSSGGPTREQLDALAAQVTAAAADLPSGSSLQKDKATVDTAAAGFTALATWLNRAAPADPQGGGTPSGTSGSTLNIPDNCGNARSTALWTALARANQQNPQGSAACTSYQRFVKGLQAIFPTTTTANANQMWVWILGQVRLVSLGYVTPIFQAVVAESSTVTVTSSGDAYERGYTAAQSDVAALLKDSSVGVDDLQAAARALAAVSKDLETYDADLAKVGPALTTLAAGIRGLPTGGGGADTNVSGEQVMNAPEVKAAYSNVDPTSTDPNSPVRKVSAALLTAQRTDAANQAAMNTLTADPNVNATQLAALLKASATEAQQLASLTTQVKALQTGMKTLSTAIAAAQTQARSVQAQTAQTSTGAAALAKQIATLQQQLASASGAGAGTAAQTAKVATGATQLSTAASGAAQAASGLSTTVDKVDTASKSVSSKTKDAASSVKNTSTTVSNQASQQPANPNTTASMGTDTAAQPGHPNVSWWTPLAAMAMWLGAMTMYMLFRPISSATRRSDAGPLALVGEVLAPGVVIGAIQALIMTIVSAQVMHLGALETARTFGVMALMAVAFMATNFVLTAVFGAIGRILSVIFALVTGLGVATNALPQIFDTIRNLSPLTPAVDALRGIATGAPGTGGAIGNLALWAVGSVALAALLILRARLAEAPRVATANA